MLAIWGVPLGFPPYHYDNNYYYGCPYRFRTGTGLCVASLECALVLPGVHYYYVLLSRSMTEP